MLDFGKSQAQEAKLPFCQSDCHFVSCSAILSVGAAGGSGGVGGVRTGNLLYIGTGARVYW